MGKHQVQAHSAGLYPLGSITEDTYTVMSEKGISLDGQWSKGLRDVPVAQMDVVVDMGWEIECPCPTTSRDAWWSGIPPIPTAEASNLFARCVT